MTDVLSPSSKAVRLYYVLVGLTGRDLPFHILHYNATALYVKITCEDSRKWGGKKNYIVAPASLEIEPHNTFLLLVREVEENIWDVKIVDAEMGR